jgi:hypothetical protein
MDNTAFKRIADDFKSADLERKINIYISTEGLTQEQYKELLRMFPLSELHRLEAALG